jgi:hypothetical protein
MGHRQTLMIQFNSIVGPTTPKKKNSKYLFKQCLILKGTNSQKEFKNKTKLKLLSPPLLPLPHGVFL